MKRNQSGFGAFELVFILLTIGIIVAASLFILYQKSTDSAAMPGPKRTLVTLEDSGSTNFAGWKLTIYSDGSASLKCSSGPGINKSCNDSSFKANTFPAQKLSNDLVEAPLSSNLLCASSVSSGSVKTLTYKGKSFTGIDCYFAQHANSSLSKDIVPFLQKLNLD